MIPRSLGELVDRLSILNVKLFAVQDQVQDAARRMVDLDAGTVRKLADLNADRNRTMTALDECLAEAVSSHTAAIDPRTKC